MFKKTKWANRILSIQDKDGLWGYFHTLSEPSKYPITTEQALRRLSILGYTGEDEAIRKTICYMDDCLRGKRQIPDRCEKTHDWDIFTDLMLSTWVRRFTPDCASANTVADRWAAVITAAFASGAYYNHDYIAAFQIAFGKPPQGCRLTDFVSFYQVSLVAELLDEKTENAVFDYILQHAKGIYYIYDKPIGNAYLSALPDCFKSKTASRYLGAMEILATYKKSKNKLWFVVDWLNANKNENGKWDMGSVVNDKVYFPLSNDWRPKGVREYDCTYRIEKLIKAIKE